jgi:hypothetical protein
MFLQRVYKLWRCGARLAVQPHSETCRESVPLSPALGQHHELAQHLGTATLRLYAHSAHSIVLLKGFMDVVAWVPEHLPQLEFSQDNVHLSCKYSVPLGNSLMPQKEPPFPALCINLDSTKSATAETYLSREQDGHKLP